MKKLVTVVVLCCISMTVFAIGEGNLVGTYADDQGNQLIIRNDAFILGTGSGLPLAFGNTSVGGDNPWTGLGGLRFYIKPGYSSNTHHATLINIWLQRSDNQILAINIFDYNIDTNELTVSMWNIITGNLSGVVITRYRRVTS